MKGAGVEALKAGALTGLLLALVFAPRLWEVLLRPLFPGADVLVYARTSFPVLLAEHARLVFLSSGLAAVCGVGLGVLVTRPWGRDFLPAVDGLTAAGQTIPPVAVLAMAVPATGFGAEPTIVALFLYGLLPILRGTASGIESVPRAAREAAIGMGMTDRQILAKIELPLAWPVIMAGVRASVVVNIGTATIGATIGAGGLGAPIIAGLTGGNPAWILEGAAVAGLFAVVADYALGRVETLFAGTRFRARRA